MENDILNKSIQNGFTHSKTDFENEFVHGKYINKGFVDTENLESEFKQDNEKEKKDEEIPPVGIITLFRYSSKLDKILMCIAVLIAVVSGASMPAVMIIFGEVIDKLITYDRVLKNLTNATMTREEFLGETANLCIWNAGFGFAFILCNYIMVSFFSIAAANQAFKIRCMFMSSVLKQDIGWYDTNETGDFASRITGDLIRIQDGIGEKVGICISFLSSTVLCICCGLYYGWKLGLVVLSTTPVFTIAMAIMSRFQASVAREEMQAYGQAGAVAEEVLSSIKTVFAFGGEKKEIQRYENCLIPAREKGIKRGFITGLGEGISWFCIYSGFALAFWYGVSLIVEDMGKDKEEREYTGGTLIIVFYNVMSGAMFVGQSVPYFEAFALARGSAAKIYNLIDRVPSIDSSSKLGKCPEFIKGFIRIKDACFNYPARPDVPVLQGLSLDINPGETIAFVGPSGCGKSTIIQLILRFYDTVSGSVEIDEHNVKDLNVGWLRDHIGLVGQEPVLFSTTIAENIRYGKLDATEEEIEEAAKIANAHDFIDALPLRYNTLVGERGTQLSGGQKQRIAIARALIKNPKILLLDEATSALDTESESVVQAALDKARLGRTTIIVAHRLSTIRTADKIIVLSGGKVQEYGTHDDLMLKKGIYFLLVSTQTKTDEEAGDSDDSDEDAPVQERKPSILSNGSVRSVNGIKNILQRQLSNVSATFDHQNTITEKFPRQMSLDAAFKRQISNYSLEPYTGVLNDEEDIDEKTAQPSQSRLFQMSAPEWPYTIAGGLSSLLIGLHFPAFGIMFGAILGVLSNEPDKVKSNTGFFCILFVLMAISSGFLSFLKIFMFTIAGEKLTSRLRKMVFSNIITQDMEFFDDPKNSVGSLCARLTSDASSVQGATGSRLGTLTQAASTLIASIILAVVLNYKIGLVVLAFVPFVVLGSFFESRVVSGSVTSEKLGTETASKIAIEAIESIRTVASLHQEETFYWQFHNALIGPHRKSRAKSHVRGVVYGFAQGLQAFAYAGSMYYGSTLVASRELSYENLLKILEGVMWGVMVIGQSVAFTPDYQKAKFAAVRIFKLLDLKPKIDSFSRDGKLLNNVNGFVQFQKVHFNYPSRPSVKILKGLNLEVEPGQTVALVGSSGCGKSTCVQLIQRFYDTLSGSVLLDNENVKDINIANLRSHIGVVSQEPVLFSYSIAENIAYGDNSNKMDMNRVIEAARQANIHNFITSLPQGYHTPVGDKGTQLSGGQKQRVAIARALLRNPKVLLLDEATSALDAESEKVVQEALDKASSGRTCIIIAHRLTTIQNADIIMVIHKGKVVESGTHQELFARKGHYYKFCNMQNGT